MANKIVSNLLSHGFKEKTGQCIFERHLFDDFKVTVSCEDGWVEDGFINFYIYADRFVPFIEAIFSGESNAKLIQPRKLIRDQSGCLCMVSTSVEIIDGEWTIWLSGEEIRLNDLLSLFSESKSIEGFYDSIYIRSNRYFIWIETIWVYLFLKKCLGIVSPVEIYCDLNQNGMGSLFKRWNLKSELSVERLAEILLGSLISKAHNIKGVALSGGELANRNTRNRRYHLCLRFIFLNADTSSCCGSFLRLRAPPQPTRLTIR